jgi:competence ComEA-like helix-hairpin-helix protein
VAAESEDSLRVNINSADVEELEELPEVAPATAEEIIAYRRANGLFSTVDELASVHNSKVLEGLRFRALLTEGGAEGLELVKV